jgi:hypothetical protein
MQVKPGLSTGNSVIGNIVIRSFLDEEELEMLILSILEEAFKIVSSQAE